MQNINILPEKISKQPSPTVFPKLTTYIRILILSLCILDPNHAIACKSSQHNIDNTREMTVDEIEQVEDIFKNYKKYPQITQTRREGIKEYTYFITENGTPYCMVITPEDIILQPLEVKKDDNKIEVSVKAYDISECRKMCFDVLRGLVQAKLKDGQYQLTIPNINIQISKIPTGQELYKVTISVQLIENMNVSDTDFYITGQAFTSPKKSQDTTHWKNSIIEKNPNKTVKFDSTTVLIDDQQTGIEFTTATISN